MPLCGTYWLVESRITSDVKNRAAYPFSTHCLKERLFEYESGAILLRR
jgi:hypothetical protein